MDMLEKVIVALQKKNIEIIDPVVKEIEEEVVSNKNMSFEKKAVDEILKVYKLKRK
jgi:hypothetical protein